MFLQQILHTGRKDISCNIAISVINTIQISMLAGK